MFFIPGWSGRVWPVADEGLRPINLQYVETVVQSVNTFTMNFGTAASDRYCFLALASCFHFGFPQNLDNVIIGGVDASLFYCNGPIPGSDAASLSFWIAPMPAGTSGSVQVIGDHNRFVAAMYRLTGDLQSLTAHDSSNGNSPVTVPPGGAVATMATWVDDDVRPAFTMSNVTTHSTNSLSLLKHCTHSSKMSAAGENVTPTVSYGEHSMLYHDNASIR